MKKTKRKASRPPKPTRKPSKTSADAKNAQDELELCLAKVREMLATGDYDVKLASHLSWLKLNAARTANELAKIDERAEKRLRSLSWNQVAAWCRRLTDAEWSRFVREVESTRGGRSVLG